MNKYEINQALINHLLTLPDLPVLIYENAIPSAADEFITINDLSIDDDYHDFCGANDKTGILQLDVYCQREQGSKRAMQLADNIANHFKRMDLNGVIITKAVVESSLKDERYYRKPISIYYRNIS